MYLRWLKIASEHVAKARDDKQPIRSQSFLKQWRRFIQHARDPACTVRSTVYVLELMQDVAGGNVFVD